VRFAAADLIDAEYRDRLRLVRQHPARVGGERIRDDRLVRIQMAGRHGLVVADVRRADVPERGPAVRTGPLP
jgi:hypothetical protein